MICVLIVTKSFAFVAGEKYYYAYNEKIFLNEVSNKMIISCNANNISNIKIALLSNSNVIKTEWQNDSICIVTIESSQYAAFKENFIQQIGVKSVQPMYITVDGLEMGITDEFVVHFNEETLQSKIDELHQKYYVSVKEVTELYQLLSVPVNMDALEIANAYQESGLVEFSHPNFISKIELHQTIPSDPYFVNQFYLHNTGQTMANGHSGTSGADINAPEAWDITKGSSQIVIAVLDQGVTSNHPDLPNTRQVRLNGSNFADGNVNDPSPTGDNNHGNSCAGVIAASHNSEGISGIAPNCKIMPIRIFNSDGSGISTTNVANAINFAKNNGAHVISNSWGYNDDNPNLVPVIKNAISGAVTSGCVVVFSAGNTANHVSGNNGYVQFPSNVNVSGVLTVGASDRYDSQANYSPTSNTSSSNNQIIEVVAPSHRAYSCQISTETFEAWSIDIPGSAGYNPNKNDDCGILPEIGEFPSSGTNYLSYTGYFGGTSCSAPEVAGVAALILSINTNLTPIQVANIIESTARKAGGYTYQNTSGLPNGTWNSQMGYGVLDAYAAVQNAVISCTINYNNHTVSTNTTITGCVINTQNVTVQTGKKLTLDAEIYTYIQGPFSVPLGAQLEVK